MVNFQLDEMQEMLKELAREFALEEIRPKAEHWDATSTYPKETILAAHEMGLLNLHIPEAYGGPGLGSMEEVLVNEELAWGDPGFATAAYATALACAPIITGATDAQKEVWLRKVAEEGALASYAVTEPGAGSDVAACKTSAVRDGDDYIINGSKTFITNGQHADVVVVVAKTNTEVSGAKGTTLFLVDSDSPGFSRGRNLEKIGMHASDTSELFFEDIRVPSTSILGELDRGFGVLMGELQRERLALSVGAVSAAEGVLAETVAYVKERKAFGSTIATFQNTKFKLAETATDIRVLRAFVEECKGAFLKGELDVPTASMAKVATTEMQGRVADTCLQLFGGYGYMKEYGVSRAFVDARVQRIYGGTSEIMKELISRDLLG